MKFWNTGEVWWGEVQSRWPRKDSWDVLGANGGFIKTQGQDPGSERAAQTEAWLTGSWGRWVQRGCSEGLSYAKEEFQDKGDLVIVKSRLFLPLMRESMKTAGSFLEICYIPLITHPCQWALGLEEIQFYYTSLPLSLPQFYGGEGDVRASGNWGMGVWKSGYWWESFFLPCKLLGHL